jgi:hypothetical protein
MHDKVLPGRSRTLLARLEALNSPQLEGWTLAGGTGLALLLGHRVSDDFDFFRSSRSMNRLYRASPQSLPLRHSSRRRGR